MESINMKGNVKNSQAENAKSTPSNADINLVTTSGRSNSNVQQTDAELLNRQNDTVGQEEDIQDCQGEETSSDTDTVILDSEEDMEILQDELISPPPVMLSPLKDPVKPLFRYKPENPDSRASQDHQFKVPKPVAVVKPRSDAFLDVPGKRPDDVIVASAGSDLSNFWSNQMAPTSGFQELNHDKMTQTSFRRVRRYHSEPYWSDKRGIQCKGNWRTVVRTRKPSPRRTTQQNVAARHLDGNGSLREIGERHIWFKPGINHPCFSFDHDHSHGQHMPKFLRKRIRKQLELEDRKKQEESEVKHPCFHCGCPGNHMPKFMRRRLLRKQMATKLENIKGSISLKEETTVVAELPIEKMTIMTNNYTDNDSSSNSDDDLETRINKMRKRLLKRQSRMEVLERVLYKKKPKGVFIGSLMSPKYRMLKPRHKLKYLSNEN